MMSGAENGGGTVIPFTTIHPGGGAQVWQMEGVSNDSSGMLGLLMCGSMVTLLIARVEAHEDSTCVLASVSHTGP